MSQANSLIGRRRVKSGCRTCRIRKVKCDEGRPACHRCVSTGRSCDGYGVWGEGASRYKPLQPVTAISARPRPIPRACVPSTGNTQERELFDWFTSRSVVKLPGSFVSGFWSTLILQASTTEPAVLHAILALSAVHRKGVLSEQHPIPIPVKEERFALSSYSKAIAHLQPHFQTRDRAALRVALIVCIVFIALELLRGHFCSADIHLDKGLKLLAASDFGNDSTYTDDWIVHALSRLHIQRELLRQVHRHSSFQLLPPPFSVSPSSFASLAEAWYELQQLMGAVFCLNRQAQQHELPSSSLANYQNDIQNSLTHWLSTYTTSDPHLQTIFSGEEAYVYKLLRTYHLMTIIMAETCLLPGNEMIFDNYNSYFREIISILSKMWEVRSTHVTFRACPRSFVMSRSVVDMGWIPPLYYTAIKCRERSVRSEAIRLLECSFHREGVWDSQIAAVVARRVVYLEGGYYPATIPRDMNCLPGETLPSEKRLADVEMKLSGDPVEEIVLVSRGNVVSRYCVSRGEWDDLIR